MHYHTVKAILLSIFLATEHLYDYFAFACRSSVDDGSIVIVFDGGGSCPCVVTVLRRSKKLPHFLRDVADKRTSDGGHHVCAMEFSLYIPVQYRLLLKVYTSF